MVHAARHRGPSMEELANQLEPAKAAQLLVLTFVREVTQLDPDDKGNWQKIISHSLDAGLSDGQLADTFSCNQMTITRWKRGQNAPAPMARKAIKAELLEMLRKRAMSYGHGEVVPHLEAVAAD